MKIYKKLLVFLTLLIELSFFGRAEGTAVAVGGDGAALSEMAHVWGRSFDGFRAICHDGTPVDIRDLIKDRVERDAAAIKEYEKLRTGPSGRVIGTQNVAIMNVIDIDEREKKALASRVEGIFISGWDVVSTALDGRTAQERLKRAFGVDTRQRFLGEFYPRISSEDILGKFISHPDLRELKDDFETRGRVIGEDKHFGTANYAHSEQAFISCVLKGECMVDRRRKPKTIILLITSNLPACEICGPTLRHMLSSGGFRKEFVEHLYPASDGSSSVHVVYISANLPVEERVDFFDRPHYFVDTRA
jgi:hypothetical protein